MGASPQMAVLRRTVGHYHSGMRPLPDIRRSRLQQLVNEQADGNASEFGRRIDKDRRQMNAWLRDPSKPGAKNLSHKLAREIEEACLKPSGWLDTDGEESVNKSTLPQPKSHLERIDPTMLAESIAALRRVAKHLGRVYDPQEQPELLVYAYELRLSLGATPSTAEVIDMSVALNERLQTAGGRDGSENGRHAGGPDRKRAKGRAQG